MGKKASATLTRPWQGCARAFSGGPLVLVVPAVLAVLELLRGQGLGVERHERAQRPGRAADPQAQAVAAPQRPAGGAREGDAQLGLGARREPVRRLADDQ